MYSYVLKPRPGWALKEKGKGAVLCFGACSGDPTRDIPIVIAYRTYVNQPVS